MAAVRRSPRGDWETWVTFTADGKKRRRHIRRRTRAEVNEEADRVRSELRGGTMPDGGKATVAEYLTSWIESWEATGRVRPSTVTAYRMDFKHIDRVIGGVQIGKLTPEQVESLYRTMLKRGLAPGSVLHVKRTLSACLNTAVARSRIARNPVALAHAPADEPPDIEPLSGLEVQLLLTSVRGRRNGARWVVAVAVGLRQGEALGLQWSDVDFEAGTLAVVRSLSRRPWKHGCEPDDRCSAKKPQFCPDAVGGGLVAAKLKTRAGRRTLALSEPLSEVLKTQRRAQAAERLLAGELWQDGGWTFASEIGTPIDPRNDLRTWQTVKQEAGIERHVRPHDLRHTAATLQLLAGTDSRVLQGLFGWSSPTLVTRYAHLVQQAKRQAADRMAGMLWSTADSG